MIRITNKATLIPLLTIAFTMLLFGCSDDGTGPGNNESQLEVHTIKDIPADTANTGDITYFSLTDQKIISASDSASANWDIAFSGTTIYTNSEASGPGQAGAVVLDQSFEATTMAPSEGLSVDTDTLLAIPAGSGNGWYNYNFNEHAIRPIAGKTIVIRTADGGHYAKMHIISYYKGNPDTSSDEFINNPDNRPADRFYTFEYAIQMDGSHNLN